MTIKSSIHIKRRDDKIIISVKNLGVASKQDGRSSTIFCPALKVLGYSPKNKGEAFSDFQKNLTLFFNIHITNNTLDEALKSFEWEKKPLQVPSFDVESNPALKLKDFELELPLAA